jgi:hypothetical protein
VTVLARSATWVSMVVRSSSNTVNRASTRERRAVTAGGVGVADVGQGACKAISLVFTSGAGAACFSAGSKPAVLRPSSLIGAGFLEEP